MGIPVPERQYVKLLLIYMVEIHTFKKLTFKAAVAIG